jgi:hypothetical protein
MSTIHFTNKGKMMDTLEKFYIFRETKMGNQIKDKVATKPNVIFETVGREDPHRGMPKSSPHGITNFPSAVKPGA